MGLKSTLDRELVWCAAMSDIAGVRRLLAAGANPDAAETMCLNACALSYARWGANPVAQARLLLKHGANAKNLPVVDYAHADDDAYVELMRKHGAFIYKDKHESSSK